MIIRARPLSPYAFRLISWAIRQVLRRNFKKLYLNKVILLPEHSYLVMSNHFSFWDGFLAFYLCNELIRKQISDGGLYVMVLEKQLQKNWWLRYSGAFSVSPGKSSVSESLAYAQEILNVPGNILLMYPQGNLESIYVRHINLKEGILEIIPGVKGKCQLIWCTTLIDYFESLKPSIYFNVLPCGTNETFNFSDLSGQINEFHQSAIKSQFRFTREP